VNTRYCCQIATRNRDNAPRPASRWRRSGAIAGQIIPRNGDLENYLS
jgi:hypothetical protein